MFLAWWFKTTAEPLILPLSLILQNLMFSFPQEAIREESIGLNLRAKMLKSEVYFATISGFSPFDILEISHTMIISLLWESFPTLARYLPSCENERHLS